MTQIEIILHKIEPGLWNRLIKEDLTENTKKNIKASKNWDKIAEDLTKNEEKPTGESALMEFFRDIYSKGDEELRRAMDKSFVESKGTVLSTNWSEVGSKTVEIKTPDNVEWKKD
uniref:Protein SGT1 homolog A (Trinotate prediction) n=1 Tax=Henneguya salminicola TaxID=69463 RepID=A0A6G3MI13_HENSL